MGAADNAINTAQLLARGANVRRHFCFMVLAHDRRHVVQCTDALMPYKEFVMVDISFASTTKPALAVQAEHGCPCLLTAVAEVLLSHRPL
eukprot:XP_001705981.1 Hypothetical protein GL50803_35982 [Giardia lamblia ATCC 50803]